MNILMLRHSAGFEHTFLPDAEVTLKQLGREHDWGVRTTHKLEAVSAKALEELDVLVFATTGDLAFSDEQRQAILAFVRGGKGFVGIHNAADSCYDWPEYGEMLNGYFAGHPWHEEVNVIVEDTAHPATAHLGASFRVTDEIYTFKEYSRDRTHVLMRLDNESVDISKGNRDDKDYALGWCHSYGQGRVIYTGLGHPDALWYEDWFRQHIVGCLQWAAGE